MWLWLADRIARTQITPTDFFRSAYIWRFKKTEVDVSLDVKKYDKDQTVPPYVEAYIDHIQRTEKGGSHAMQALQRAD